MNDEKIKEIFSKHLKDKHVNEAAAETHQEMAENILADIYTGQAVDKSVWALLLKIIRCMARVNLLSPYFKEAPGADTVSFGPEFFDDIDFFFQTSRDAMAHVVANFDRLISERVKATYDIEDFRVMLHYVEKQLYEHTESRTVSGQITLARTEFDLMNRGLTWNFRAVIGKDNYVQFAEEFNKHLPSLKIYYAMAASPPKSGLKSN